MKKRTLRRLRRALKKRQVLAAPKRRSFSIADARRAAEHYETRP